MGSGSVPAYGVLESGFNDDLTLEQAQHLAVNAIKAGILYDQGSGSNVDFVILRQNKTDYFRNYEIVGQKLLKKSQHYNFIPNNIRKIISDFKQKSDHFRKGTKRKRNGNRKVNINWR